MTRQTLGRIVRSMWLLLIIAFLAVLFASLSTREPNEENQQPVTQATLFADVSAGQTTLRRHLGKRVWVTRLDAALRDQLLLLEPFLLDAKAGCQIADSLCVLDASSSRDGIEIVFSRQAPPTLPTAAPWVSGLVDPADGSAYDVLGRAYRGTAARAQETAPRVALSVVELSSGDSAK